MTPAQITAEAPYEDAVWGSFQTQYWDSAHPGMLVSRYMLPNEDERLVSNCNLACWQQGQHPDWVLYACDNNGNPTRENPSYNTGFGDVPLNIDNQDVVNYQINMIATYMIKNGYNALAVDNIIFENYGHAPNPILGQGNPQPGWYGCGYYDTSGGFHQVYHGGLYAQDPTWIKDQLNWLATARQMFDSDPTLAPYHLKIVMNHALYDATPDPNEAQALTYVDGMLDENGFTHYDSYTQTGSAEMFAETLSWMEYAQAHHKAIWIIDYFCDDGYVYNTTTPCPTTLSPAQADWALSTYAIGNEGGAGVYPAPIGGAAPSYRSEYSTEIGKPCAAYVRAQTNLYYRKFQGALVLVDPGNGTQVTYTLPANHTYTDIEHRPVASPLVINGPDGYVLLTSNGCS